MSTGPGPTAQTIAIVKKVFGAKWHFVRGYAPLGSGGGHDGWDIGAPTGTPVYALADGVVNYAQHEDTDPNPLRNWAKGGGNVVNVDVGGSLRFQYAHLDTILVKKGQTVKKGQLIGTVGSTTTGGHFTSGPHLHFGVWNLKTGKMIDPAPFITAYTIINAIPGASPSLDAWAGIVSFPVGHVITEADVDKMLTALTKAHFFDGAGGNIAYGETERILRTAVGEPWNKDLQDRLQAQLFGAAKAATDNPLNAIAGSVGGFLATLTDPGTWIRILVFLLGTFMTLYGGVSLLKAA